MLPYSGSGPNSGSSAHTLANLGVSRLFRQSPGDAFYDMQVVAATSGKLPTQANSTWTNAVVNDTLLQVRVKDDGKIAFDPIHPTSQNAAGVVFCR